MHGLLHFELLAALHCACIVLLMCNASTDHLREPQCLHELHCWPLGCQLIPVWSESAWVVNNTQSSISMTPFLYTTLSWSCLMFWSATNPLVYRLLYLYTGWPLAAFRWPLAASRWPMPLDDHCPLRKTQSPHNNRARACIVAGLRSTHCLGDLVAEPQKGSNRVPHSHPCIQPLLPHSWWSPFLSQICWSRFYSTLTASVKDTSSLIPWSICLLIRFPGVPRQGLFPVALHLHGSSVAHQTMLDCCCCCGACSKNHIPVSFHLILTLLPQCHD